MEYLLETNYKYSGSGMLSKKVGYIYPENGIYTRKVLKHRRWSMYPDCVAYTRKVKYIPGKLSIYPESGVYTRKVEYIPGK